MSHMDTYLEIVALHKAIEDQRRLINDLSRHNKENMQQVNGEFKQSTHGQRMLGVLQQAEESLTKSESSLGRASDSLRRLEQNIR